MDELEIRKALVCYESTSPFYWRRNFVCLPNSNSFTSWEADLLVCSNRFYLTEIEIKSAWQDWVNDKKKEKFKPSLQGGRKYGWGKIKYFWYAVDASFADRYVEAGIPEWAGVIAVGKGSSNITHCWVVRPAHVLTGHKKLDDKQVLEFARLAANRIWTSIA